MRDPGDVEGRHRGDERGEQGDGLPGLQPRPFGQEMRERACLPSLQDEERSTIAAASQVAQSQHVRMVGCLEGRDFGGQVVERRRRVEHLEGDGAVTGAVPEQHGGP